MTFSYFNVIITFLPSSPLSPFPSGPCLQGDDEEGHGGEEDGRPEDKKQ